MQIGHLHILVNDVAVSKRFYQEVFGLTELTEEDFGVILRDDSGMDFVIGPAKPDQAQGQRMHFGFRQQSRKAVKHMFEQLKAEGQDFETAYVENDFITLFALNDPDGNRVEVYYAGDF